MISVTPSRWRGLAIGARTLPSSMQLRPPMDRLPDAVMRSISMKQAARRSSGPCNEEVAKEGRLRPLHTRDLHKAWYKLAADARRRD